MTDDARYCPACNTPWNGKKCACGYKAKATDAVGDGPPAQCEVEGCGNEPQIRKAGQWMCWGCYDDWKIENGALDPIQEEVLRRAGQLPEGYQRR